MRHVTGFLLAMAAMVALFLGGGWGVARFNDILVAHGLRDAAAWTSLHNVLPLVALLGTGLFIGILVSVRRVSALAPGLPGLALIGWSALVILRGRTALSYIPMSGSHLADGFSAMLSSGALMLVGAGLIIPLFMPSRWRGYRAEAEEDEYDDDLAATSSALGLVP